MKFKILIRLSCFIITLIFLPIAAQSVRVVYQYDFKTDSLSTQTNSELMYLDIRDGKSTFQSQLTHDSDSLHLFNKSKVKEIILKDLPAGKIDMITQPFNTPVMLGDQMTFLVEQRADLKWKIGGQGELIQGFKTQTAETSFGGRRWKAWFAPAIPIQDGPYKFCGLPGLIVKLESADKTHQFLLKGLKNRDIQPFNKTVGHYIKVSNKKYEDLLGEFKQDPVKYLRGAMMTSAGTSKITNSKTGETLSEGNIKTLRAVEEIMRQKFEKNNNPIELNHKIEYK